MSSLLETLRQCGYLSYLDFHFAGTMAHMADTQEPLTMLGAAVASRYTMRGHVCAPLSILGGKRIDTKAVHEQELHWPNTRKWISALEKSPLVYCPQKGSLKPPSPTAPLVLESGRLYLARYWMYEKNLARKISARASSRPEDLDSAILRDGLHRLFPSDKGSTDPRQKQAVRLAMEHSLAIITGGPGTGKTSTVVKLLVLLFEQAKMANTKLPRVLLLAPTGKAAKRMEESTRSALDASASMEILCDEDIKQAIRKIAGSTIHRALGYSPRTPTSFVHNETNPLNADVVIVDEASMVDLPLMWKLFDAVDDHARLILLGDKDQLVSVEVGAVLGDICNHETKTRQVAMFSGIGDCMVNLTHSYRFDAGQGIDLLAKAVNSGDSKKALEYLKGDKWPDLTLVSPDNKTSLDDILRPIIKDGYSKLMKQKEPQKRLNALSSFRVLCALRKGPSGSLRVNELAERFLGLRSSVRDQDLWYDGRPIMVTKNDYQLELFNGDVGIICRDKDHENTYRAFFPDKANSFLPSQLPPHETVFAMTIHKSQGSEYDHVLVIMPEKISSIATRELLYTAITRARKSVSIIASEKILLHAIKTPVIRTSGLGDYLWEF